MDWVWYAWSWVWPYPAFDSSKLKMLIKTAVIRINIHKRKNAENISKLKIEALESVKEAKDEYSRIKVEAMIQCEKKVGLYEALLLMCDNLLTKLPLIDLSTEMPIELIEAIHTLMYAAPRVGVEEVQLLAQQLALKYGEHVVRDATNNEYAQVNSQVVVGLSVAPPDELLVRKYLKDFYAKSDGGPVALPDPPSSSVSLNPQQPLKQQGQQQQYLQTDSNYYGTYITNPSAPLNLPFPPTPPHMPFPPPSQSPEYSNDDEFRDDDDGESRNGKQQNSLYPVISKKTDKNNKTNNANHNDKTNNANHNNNNNNKKIKQEVDNSSDDVNNEEEVSWDSLNSRLQALRDKTR